LADEKVNWWYLSASRKEFQTMGMRLPQSSSRPLSIRFVTISIFSALVLAAAPPSEARQASGDLLCSPSSAQFNDVAVGHSSTQELVLTNSGGTSATISAISVGGSEFSISGFDLPATIGAGQSVAGLVTFTPTSDGSANGTITITSTAENPSLQVSLEGSGVKGGTLTASPASLSFGHVDIGSTLTHSVVLSNPHSASVTITALQTTGAGFSVSGPSLPATIESGQSITLNVSYSPQTAGPEAGSIYVDGAGLNIFLRGTAVPTGQLSITPASLSFGNVNVGSSTTQPATMTASGGSVTVSSASTSNSQFSIAGILLPVNISTGQTVSFDVVFAPTATGSDSATLTFASNATNQSSEVLSGTGTQTQYSVNLTWSASTSSVTGYNVYRGTTPGSYSRINSALDANTAYTDSTVSSGITYYYAATSVNSSGQESGYSTPVEVSIP
jgi:hypothetical protein